MVFVFSLTLSQEGVQIFVKVPSGKTITVEVQESHTIYQLKAAIKKKEGCRRAYQHVFYNGRQKFQSTENHEELTDDLTMKNIHVYAGMEFRLVRQRFN